MQQNTLILMYHGLGLESADAPMFFTQRMNVVVLAAIVLAGCRSVDGYRRLPVARFDGGFAEVPGSDKLIARFLPLGRAPANSTTAQGSVSEQGPSTAAAPSHRDADQWWQGLDEPEPGPPASIPEPHSPRFWLDIYGKLRGRHDSDSSGQSLPDGPVAMAKPTQTHSEVLVSHQVSVPVSLCQPEAYDSRFAAESSSRTTAVDAGGNSLIMQATPSSVHLPLLADPPTHLDAGGAGDAAEPS